MTNYVGSHSSNFQLLTEVFIHMTGPDDLLIVGFKNCKQLHLAKIVRTNNKIFSFINLISILFKTYKK